MAWIINRLIKVGAKAALSRSEVASSRRFGLSLVRHCGAVFG